MEEMRTPFIMNYTMARAEVLHGLTPKELVAEANQVFEEIQLINQVSEVDEETIQ